ncbi:MAG: TolB family protein, partial [Betaproteobacteria bacterium]
ANTDIYAQAADGSGREEQIVNSPGGSTKVPLGWSTRGGLFFSASNRAGGYDLWTLAAGSGERPALLFNGEQRAQFQDATVSRDGRFVAFGSTGEIYLQTLPHGPRVLVAADGAYRARWRDDGRELYYIANGKLMAVTVRLRAGIELGAPETLFDIPANVPPWSLAYAPLGDGQHFLFELPVSTKPPAPLTAMLNWAAATASPH